MELINLLIIFIFGILVGSFLGVVVDRLPKKESILRGRSHCDNCKKTLSAFDLIPVFSFVFLRGRCRYCKAKLSLFYPLIEITTGILYVCVYLLFGQENLKLTIDLLFYLYIVSTLIALFFIDLKYGVLPFSLLFPATIATFFYFALNTQYLLLNNILAAIGGFLFFFVLFLITRGRGMGFGDVIYALFMGLLLGIPKIVLGLYVAFVGGAIIALVLIAMKLKKLKGSTIPFGPFLVVGTIISMFWGDYLISLTFNVLQFTIK